MSNLLYQDKSAVHQAGHALEQLDQRIAEYGNHDQYRRDQAGQDDARELRRTVEKYVQAPLSELILAGKLTQGSGWQFIQQGEHEGEKWPTLLPGLSPVSLHEPPPGLFLVQPVILKPLLNQCSSGLMLKSNSLFFLRKFHN